MCVCVCVCVLQTFDECVSAGGSDCAPEKLWLQIPFFCGHYSECWYVFQTHTAVMYLLYTISIRHVLPYGLMSSCGCMSLPCRWVWVLTCTVISLPAHASV